MTIGRSVRAVLAPRVIAVRTAPRVRSNAVTALGATLAVCAASSAFAAPQAAPRATSGIPLTPVSCCDGVYGTAQIQGEQVWQTSVADGYLYFQIPAAALQTLPGQPLFVAVQYYDTGYNQLSYQYASTANPYAPPEITVHSSLRNSNTFSTSYFEMASPALQAQQNGGLDFRIYSNQGPISIASVTIQTTPFPNPAMQLALTAPWLNSYPASANAATLQGKTMAGYQGWFSCPNDLSDGGWTHWSGTAPFAVLPGFPNWPDVSGYPANSAYPGARCAADQVLTQSGKHAYVYSSSNPDVVAQHFAWMKDFNIDGIFLQRFLGSGSVPGNHPEWVLANIRKSAWQNKRLWAMEYDVSELNNDNVVATIEADWKWLNDSAHVRSDGNYAHDKGKPVVVIWGLACRPGYTPQVADTLVEFFKNDPNYGGNYVIGGICNQWQTMTDWFENFQRYDGLQVWQPQNNTADHTQFTAWGIDWYPHVWAGHYEGGVEYWGNLYNVISAGADRFFIGMFDEYGEDTAIIPISNDPPAGTPAMLTNAGSPINWWLKLSDYGKRMMLKKIPLTPTMPTP